MDTNHIDIIKTYMSQIGKYKLLNQEDEQRIAKRIKQYQRILIGRILESEIGRDALAEAAENYVRSNLKKSDIFEAFEDTQDDNIVINDAESVIKKTATLLIEQCKAYPIIDDKKKVLDSVCSIQLASSLLNNICDLIQKKQGAGSEKIIRVNDHITQAKNELITKNLKLVVTVARDHQNRGVEYDDLIQEGNIGLMKAVNKFDYHKGTRFSTYAYWWIRQSIVRAIADTARTVRIPVYLVEHFNKVIKAMGDLTAENVQYPSKEVIAVKADLTIEQVNKVLKSMHKVVSLDAPLSHDKEGTLADMIEAPNSVSPEEMYIRKSYLKVLNEVISSKLSPKEEKIIRLRFGLSENYYDDDHTLESIGTKFGHSKERIRQVIHGVKPKDGILDILSKSKLNNLKSLIKD